MQSIVGKMFVISSDLTVRTVVSKPITRIVEIVTILCIQMATNGLSVSNDNSITVLAHYKIDVNIVNRFSVYKKGGHSYDCDVRYQDHNKNSIVTICSKGQVIIGAKDVIFRPSRDDSNPWRMVFSKSEPKIWCFNPKIKSENRRLERLDACRGKTQEIPDFIQRFNHLSTTTGVVDHSNTNSTSGHFLFFTINGQPMYCYQPSKDYSLICNSKDYWKPLFSQCFPQTTDSPPNGRTVVLIGFGVFVVIVVLVFVIVFIDRRLKASNERQQETTSETISEGNSGNDISMSSGTNPSVKLTGKSTLIMKGMKEGSVHSKQTIGSRSSH